jgi:diguanylate cyclase (GGDEF)-like protein
MLLARPGTKESYHAFFNVYQGIPPLFGGIVALAYAFRSEHRRETVRFGWALIGLGCLSFAVGQGLWTYYETIKGIEVPFPSWSDAGYVGAYPFLISGVLLLFTNVHAVAGRARLLMDGAIAACGAGVLSWYFLVGHLWAKSDVSQLGKLISVAYPLGDIACVFIAIVAFAGAGSNRGYRRTFAVMACGILMLTFADTVFTYKSLNSSYETGSWNDWGWSFGWILIAFAPLLQQWIPTVEKEQPVKFVKIVRLAGNGVRAFGPYFVAIGALSITFIHDYRGDGHIQAQTYGEALFLLCLILVRQVFMLLENLALARRVAQMNDTLEEMVAVRTRTLAGLQSLTKRVNSTLDGQEVAEGAMDQTCDLLGATTVALWLDRTGAQEPISAKAILGLDADRYPKISRSLEGRTPTDEIEQFQVLGGDNGTSVRTCLLAPLRWQNQTIGQIIAIREDGQYWSEVDDLLESVGVEIGTALKNSWRHEEALAAADVDSVTGLLNHRAIHQRLSRELTLAEAESTSLSVIMMDMNNFKLFNDTYGHVVGDQVLKTVSEQLSRVCGDAGLPARYGGDEFVVVLPRTIPEEAERIAHMIKDSLRDFDYIRAGDDRRVPIGLSFGIAAYPNDGQNRHELITTADKNLYRAKGSDTGIARTTDGQRINRELRAQASFETLDILVDSIDNKDRYTRKHSEDVTEYSLWIAEELGLSEETMRTIRMAGLLHDVGKIGVPDEVLRKPGRLSAEEYEMMKRHPRLGELIVSAIPGMEGIVDGVRSHHERWDGGGYPDQLQGDEIPLLGRIIAVADAFSAMTTDRPYRKGMDWTIALEQIRSNMGTQFDPKLATAFLTAVSKRRRPKTTLKLPAELLRAA